MITTNRIEGRSPFSMERAETMTDRIVRALAKLEPFDSLSDDALSALANRCRFARYAAHQHIIDERDAATEVFFIVSGRVRISVHSPLGKEMSFGDLEGGEMFGELAAIDGEPRVAGVVALADTLVVSMSRDAFQAALRAHPSVAVQVLRRLVGRLRLYSRRMYEYRNLDVRSRVRAELIRLSEGRVEEDNTASIAPAPTHASIANRICSGREAVSRELSSLTRRGLIERTGDVLSIRDFDGLAEMVDVALRS